MRDSFHNGNANQPLAGADTLGLGSILMGAGSTAITEGSIAGIAAGSFRVVVGGEVIWVGDIFQGLQE